MKIISEPYEPALNILKRFQRKNKPGRLNRYCVHQLTEDGILLFNLMTRELILLTEDEYENLAELDYLWERWFIITEDTNEKELVDFLRLILTRQRKKTEDITKYLIYTTTDCNARCFYCFQQGRSRIHMSQETAEKVVRYIYDHCGGKEVRLTWFGGEPLYNAHVIDTICNGLRRVGIKFNSIIVTNGYLLNGEMIRRAEAVWNLKNVQIAMDGTEKIYNRSKSYIYQNVNPYRVVMDNIGLILDASISVSIRLNMDLHNAQNLMDLVDELEEHFGKKKGVYIYVAHLFKEGKTMEQLHSEDGWRKRKEAMEQLVHRIEQYGMGLKRGIRKTLPINSCMADSGDSVTIAPTGEIGLCDHYSDSEFIGHIDQDDFIQDRVDNWRETVKELSECKDCFYYPECIRLKKCSSGNSCLVYRRDMILLKMKRQIQNEYDQWKCCETTVENEQIDFC